MSVSVVLLASSTWVVGLVLQHVVLYDCPVPRQLLQYGSAQTRTGGVFSYRGCAISSSLGAPLLESFQKRALNIGIKCRSQYTHSDVCRSWDRERASELPPNILFIQYICCHLNSLLSVDGLIKLRIQRVFIGVLCRQMSSCNQSETERCYFWKGFL